VTEDEDGGFCGGGGVPCFTPGINGGGDVCMGQGEGLFRVGDLEGLFRCECCAFWKGQGEGLFREGALEDIGEGDDVRGMYSG